MQLSSYLGRESDQARGWTSGKLVWAQFPGGTRISLLLMTSPAVRTAQPALYCVILLFVRGQNGRGVN